MLKLIVAGLFFLKLCTAFLLDDLPPASNSLLTSLAVGDAAFAMPVVSIAFVVPHANLTGISVRSELKKYFSFDPQVRWMPPQAAGKNGSAKLRQSSPKTILPRFQVNPVYVNNLSVSQAVKKVFCSNGSRGLNTILFVIDRKIQSVDEANLLNLLTTLANGAGIPSLIWSNTAYQIEETLLTETYRKQTFLLTPRIRDQALAILDLLKDQSLQPYSIIVSMQAPGAASFIRVLYELKDSAAQTDDHEMDFRSWLTHVATLPAWTSPAAFRKAVQDELLFVRDTTHARTIVVWCTPDELSKMLEEARPLGMVSESYLWIGGQPLLYAIEESRPDKPQHHGGRAQIALPLGTVITTYDDSIAAQLDVVKAATEMWTLAVRKLAASQHIQNAADLAPGDLCSDKKQKQWKFNALFSRYLSWARYMLESTSLASLQKIKFSYLGHNQNWRHLGSWTKATGVVISDKQLVEWSTIRGVSTKIEKAFLKIVTLEEPPYIIYSERDPLTGACPDKGVLCELAPLDNTAVTNLTQTPDKAKNDTRMACCSGLCIDLLERLAKDCGFSYQLFEVKDRKWGVKDKATGEWNGLINVLINQEADVVFTSLKINQERSEVIEFTHPFLETGITILVGVRQGAISPWAILEPFSPLAWFAILFVCVHTVVLAAYLFEYFSVSLTPSQADSPRNPKLSVFSSMWLCWAMLFKAAVKVKVPAALSAKIMTGAWAMFSVVFVSSYMANLAAFMITKDDYYVFSGMDDYHLQNPYLKNPPFRFATVGSGATEAFIKRNYPRLHEYMRPYLQTSASAGIQALKDGKLDAFIYDATVLDYKSNHDTNCELATVGKWAAQTGYGIGFPRGSNWLAIFDKHILAYQYNGYMHKLSEYWMSGACRFRKQQETNKSYQLGILNFTSAFVLLSMGLVLCSIILLVEHFISRYLVSYLINKRSENAMITPRRSQPPRLFGWASSNGTSGRQGGADTSLLGRLVYNITIQRCQNCTGRGHSAQVCPSHPELHLIMKNLNGHHTDVSRCNSTPPKSS